MKISIKIVMEIGKMGQLSISDKVRDEEGLEWWVLSLFPEINSVVCITTVEERFDRKAFRPEELTII